MIKIKSLVFFISCCLVISLISSCKPIGYTQTSTVENLNKGKNISVSLGGEPSSLDPSFVSSSDSINIILHIFEGLTRVNKENQIENAQAKDIKVSEDGLKYSITLRDDIKWSDGKDVTAYDFVYAWQRAIDPRYSTNLSDSFFVIKNAVKIINGDVDMEELGLKVISPKYFEITLEHPCTYFYQLLAKPPFMPVRSEIAKGNSGEWTLTPSTYIGNGPYKMASWKHNDSIILQKNKGYYEFDKLGPEQIRFLLSDDDVSTVQAFTNHEICFTNKIPISEINYWTPKPEFHSEDIYSVSFLGFQCRKHPFNDIRVRKALSLAIDRSYLAEQIVKTENSAAGAFVSPGIKEADGKTYFRDAGGNYYSAKAEDYQNNVQEAKRLLAEAGFPNGTGFPPFQYGYYVSSENTRVAEVLQYMWKQTLGITAILSFQDIDIFLSSASKGEFETFNQDFLTIVGDPIFLLTTFRSNSRANNLKWSNSEFDSVLNKAQTSGNDAERFKLLHQAEDILMEDMPLAPLYFPKNQFIMDTKLQGYYSSPEGHSYFMYATLSD